MPVTLDYQTPAPPRPSNQRAAFWGTFALAGFAGVVLGDWVMNAWYRVRSPDGGVFMLACLSLLAVAVVLLAVRVALPRRTRSPLVALGVGLLGPLAGLVLLDIFVF